MVKMISRRCLRYIKKENDSADSSQDLECSSEQKSLFSPKDLAKLAKEWEDKRKEEHLARHAFLSGGSFWGPSPPLHRVGRRKTAFARKSSDPRFQAFRVFDHKDPGFCCGVVGQSYRKTAAAAAAEPGEH